MKNFILPLLLLIAMLFAFAGDLSQNRISDPGSKPELPFIEGQVCIKFKENTGAFSSMEGPVVFGIKSLDEKAARFEVKHLVKRFLHRPIPERSGLPDLSRIYKISFPEKFSPIEVAQAFAADPNVEYAEPVYMSQLDAVPIDPMYNLQPFLPQVMAEEAWDIHKGQQGGVPVVIAVLDVGTDWLHEDLRQNTWENLGEDADGDGFTIRFSNGQWQLDPGDLNGIDDDGNGYVDDLIGWDFYGFETSGDGSNPDPDWDASYYFHGTHTAGLAAGRTDNNKGIACISWNLEYMPLQIDSDNDATAYGYDGIIYAAENGADVISCSWGSDNYSSMGKDVVDYATGLGKIIICSAGNQDADILRYPGAYPGVVSVAAVNTTDQKASYSSFGPFVDIAAPGGDVDGSMLSTFPNNSYDYLDGTSMSTPLAAGLAGLIKSLHPEWSREQVIRQLIATCDDIDTLNPYYEYALGSGRINAYRALTEENVVAPQLLKITLHEYSFEDMDGDGILAQGDTVNLNVTLWNHAFMTGSNNASFSLITSDPDVTLLANEITADIPEDDFFDLPDAFTFIISGTCQPHFAELLLITSADIPVVYGDTIPLQVLLAPDGIFVFEGEEGHYDYSGSYIRMFLENIEQPVFYSTTYPASFQGFDMVFLSFGNFGANLDQGFLPSYELTLPFMEYTEEGGNIYIEMSGMFAGSILLNYPNAEEIQTLFGVEYIGDNNTENPVDTLTGITGTPYEGMMFTESTQHLNWYIDIITAAPGAYCTFEENEYGNVGIVNDGSLGQKTSYFGYALAELKDVDATSSRYNFLLKTMEFFGYEPDDGYAIANFTSDTRIGGIGLNVNFKDISLSDEGYEIISREWDFENDGIVDSYEQNPLWTYTVPGNHDVRLVVSNGEVSDTLVYPSYIRINSGMFVYEGIEGSRDNSGSYIRDFLLENSYEVTYQAGSYPASLKGYDAVFLSFGNFGSYYSKFEDDFAMTVLDYLESGGQVYLEGGDALGFDQIYNGDLLDAFGIASANDGMTNYPDSLAGQQMSIMEEMFFTSSNQMAVGYIDKYILGNGTEAYKELGYGIVGVQNGTPYPDPGPRTFCFSYAMAELQDGEEPGTREEFMWRILDFFGLITEIDEVTTSVTTPLEMQVYPNPTSENLEIAFNNEWKGTEASLTLYNLNGTVVMRKSITTVTSGRNQVRINLAELPPGTYLVRLMIGGKSAVNKIIKY